MNAAAALLRRGMPGVVIVSICALLGVMASPTPFASAAIGTPAASSVPARALERDRLRGQQSVGVPSVAAARAAAQNSQVRAVRTSSTVALSVPAGLVGLAVADLTVGAGSTLEKAQQSGAGWMLGWISWQNLEPVEGQYAWTSGTGNDVDNLIRAGQSAHLLTLARLQNVPAWATSDGSTHLAAVRGDALTAFGLALAAHSAGGVAAFEIFNEPNLNYEWGVSAVDASGPVGYARLLRAAYLGIKAGNPSAIVVSAGLADGAGGQSMDDLTYLRGVYAAGARGGTHFDAVGTHPYGGSYPPDQDPACGGTCLRHAELQHQILLDNGDAATPMWATEVGWLLDNPYDLSIFFNWMKVSAQQQADYLTGAVQYAQANWPWMQHVFVFNLDHSTAMWCGGPCYPPTTSVSWFSILNPDRTPRLAYTALQTLLHAAPATPTPIPTSTTNPGAIDTVLATPQRLLDTRPLGQPIPAGQSRCFSLAGQGGIPASAAGVILNVTAVGYGAPGWLTVFPSGQAVPATSTLNFDTRAYAVANGTIMRLGGGGQVCVATGTVNSAVGSADVILDATGYLSAGALAQLPMLAAPQRVADSRIAGGVISTGQSRCFTVAGVVGVAADAAAVVLNVTAVGYGTPGWLSVYPNGQAVPATSTLNFDPSEYAVANGTIVRVGSSGQVCVNVGTVNSAPGSSHVILDVTGYLTTAGLAQLPMLVAPQRLVDTRASGGAIASGQSRCFNVAGQAGIPADATAVVLNVTAVGYGAPGWLTAYPAGQAVPATSTLNFDTSEYAMANGAITALGDGGQVCIDVGTVNSAPGDAQVILDVVGSLR